MWQNQCIFFINDLTSSYPDNFSPLHSAIGIIFFRLVWRTTETRVRSWKEELFLVLCQNFFLLPNGQRKGRVLFGGALPRLYQVNNQSCIFKTAYFMFHGKLFLDKDSHDAMMDHGIMGIFRWLVCGYIMVRWHLDHSIYFFLICDLALNGIHAPGIAVNYILGIVKRVIKSVQ